MFTHTYAQNETAVLLYFMSSVRILRGLVRACEVKQQHLRSCLPKPLQIFDFWYLVSDPHILIYNIDRMCRQRQKQKVDKYLILS